MIFGKGGGVNCLVFCPSLAIIFKYHLIKSCLTDRPYNSTMYYLEQESQGSREEGDINKNFTFQKTSSSKRTIYTFFKAKYTSLE